jgi:hypothetical protein
MTTNSNSLAALRVERQTALDFCRDLAGDEWSTPSHATGWSVQDVMVHMTAGIRALITPAAVEAMTSRQIERMNDSVVAKGRSRAPQQVLHDFETWSRRGIAGLTVFNAPGARQIPLPVGELGWYPLRVFPGMFLFDWHTHLRHDIAPALDLPAPDTDDQRMTAILSWLTILLERSHRTALRWLDAPIALTLTGPGGETWRIEPAGQDRLRVAPGNSTGTAAHITAQSLQFPQWSTTRVSWRTCEVSITGSAELGARFLDSINLV